MKTQHSDEEIQLFGVGGPFFDKDQNSKGRRCCVVMLLAFL